MLISRSNFALPSSAGIVRIQVPGAAMTPEQIEAANAVARMGALGTYLANLRDESVRARCTELSVAVDKAVSEARQTPPAALERLFEPADRIFDNLNSDCVKSALDKPM
jgi:hypothetical protein